MTYSPAISPDFVSIAQDLGIHRSSKAKSGFSDGSELVPAEAGLRMQREGASFLRRPALNGATVDQEGLTNNYAVEPNMYFASFPTPDEARRYVIQGAAAALFIVSLIVTSVAVS
ncbi:ssl1498 family light-harvesting-like protein [Synechococcales cyanobacterium C]|uniref:Ssl1498 family light-harvesting-like protein n=1 Tax=Petrachloros mirabilis ULC683 TaxID=2781853 RepID=A0A8K1ZXJ9_9CYAN|nr:ssl1498 family light-harvesting-like protein [Petrachloros mirabilis]NCJ07155.1 ssl1498 family light-harvesting-like protein [Petrachloros mirabilis ULC683]